jgi:hypothetical protein
LDDGFEVRQELRRHLLRGGLGHDKDTMEVGGVKLVPV